MLNGKFKVFIPARGGSKGLLKKNILPLNSKPLIYYTLDAANEIFSREDIYVSTDSEEIKNAVELYGYKINQLRPNHLAKDDSSILDVLIYFLENEITDIPDFIVLLQPTSPLRKANHIVEALSLVNDEIDMVVSCCVSDSNPYWNLFEESDLGYLVKSKGSDFFRRQDVTPVYEFNGSIYIINTKSLISQKTLNFQKIVKYVMEKKYSIDIDDEIDFMIAEYLISK
jgi:CMP-N,N'-diacetyllegionaminic acid synthase